MMKKSITNLVILSLMFSLGSSVTSCKKAEIPEAKKEINAAEEERQRLEEERKKQEEEERKRKEEELRKQEEERIKQEEELRKKEEEFKAKEEALYNKYITPELKAGLEALGMKVNRGITPPIIEGYYLIADPRCIATTSSWGDADLESDWLDIYITFQNQDSLSVDVSTYQKWEDWSSITTGEGNFITGEGNLFTIVTESQAIYTSEEDENYDLFSSQIITGEIVRDEDGKIIAIKDMLYAVLMKDNGGAKNVLQNGTGRLFKPASGSVEAMSKTHFDNYINALSNTWNSNSVEAISIFSISK